jgi:hypothetical protein
VELEPFLQVMSKPDESTSAYLHSVLNGFDIMGIKMHKTDENEYLIHIYDILGTIGIKTKGKILDKFRTAQTDKLVLKAPVTHEFRSNDIIERGGKSDHAFGPVSTCQALVSFALHRVERSSDVLERILSAHQLPKNAFQCAYQPKAGIDTIDFLSRAIPSMSIKEFHCAGYRIDLWFPKLRIAVECDEHKHEGYDSDSERIRTYDIKEKLGCTFFRYDPYAEGFDVANMINQFLRHQMQNYWSI